MFAVKNWSQVLDATFGIPTDVAFNIMEEDDNEDNRQDYIPAHKYFLAMVSPVFKTMFFGLAKETREVVRWAVGGGQEASGKVCSKSRNTCNLDLLFIHLCQLHIYLYFKAQ
eukprot:GFUD01062612.1.p1 GENE.GFUD01062612.1~~GFUD01062612.1.p1  ORF type:complete len:112 (-),score=21.25 GFUD01062612.1:3-338(-)